MSTFLSSFRRTGCVPLEDAPLDALPSSEATALSCLELLVSQQLFSPSSSALHHNDPWFQLAPASRRALALRFLRFHCLNEDNALAHILRVAAWRKQDRPWLRPAKTMRGSAAGVPVVQLDVRGADGEVLLYSPVKFYVRADVNHGRQRFAMKTFFEQLMYVRGGPTAHASVVVLDFQDMHIRNVDLVAVKNGIQIFTQYYPEVFKKILVVNYAKWLYGTWRIVAPLLDARTLRKVVFLPDADAMREELGKCFAQADMPRWLGGKGDDGNLQLHTGQCIDAGEVARSMRARDP